QLVGGSMTQGQEMICGGRYLSCDQATRVFAADPDSRTPMRLEVRWRNGAHSTVTGVLTNRIYEISQPASTGRVDVIPVVRSEPKPILADVSSLISHAHSEEMYDDWERQPMLPRRLSRLGPGLSWHDL